MSEKTDSNLSNIRHSLSHLLAAAVLKNYPDTKLGIGPVIDNGFYYDFLFSKPVSDSDLNEIEKEMISLIAKKIKFEKETITLADAKKLFKDQPFKLELAEEYAGEGRELTIYRSGDFTDLCEGGHVKDTSEINPEGFKLTKLAGAYWHGDEKNPQLTRVYGLVFESKKELDNHLKMLEEAEKRDHKKLGPQLDLFTFSPLVGAGLPLWTPKGTILRNLLDDFVWNLRRARGYEQVDIPHLAKKELYEKSGHWDKFKNELFQIKTREGHIFALKPMNCPHHIQIFDRRPSSWRELPQRYATTTKVYRDEQTGELSGLARVRSITQDDSHVFCRESQVKEEISKIWEIVDEFYGAVGFNLKIRLSLRDPKEQEKYLGTPEMWDKAENELREIAKEKGIKVSEVQGEANFYGPKIDFMANDSLGREWQVATIQLDVNLPERFDLSCVNEKGEKERIVMIHCAIMGAIERYLAILIEHFAGAFPLWLSPVQVAVLPISEKQNGYAQEICGEIIKAGIRAEFVDKNETIGKKIREVETQKTPYIVVIGEKEEKNKTVAIRKRKHGDLGEIKAKDLIDRLLKEIKEKSLD